MSSTFLKKELATFLEVEADELTENTQLNSFTNWDSLTKVSLVALAKESFDIDLTSDQLESVITVGDLEELLFVTQGA